MGHIQSWKPSSTVNYGLSKLCYRNFVISIFNHKSSNDMALITSGFCDFSKKY